MARQIAPHDAASIQSFCPRVCIRYACRLPCQRQYSASSALFFKPVQRVAVPHNISPSGTDSIATLAASYPTRLPRGLCGAAFYNATSYGTTSALALGASLIYAFNRL